MTLRRRWKDDNIVAAFVAFLAKSRAIPGLKVDRRPDTEKDGDHGIDAIAGPFAIEHTSIDTVPEQRREGAWLGTMLGDLENTTVVSESILVVFKPGAVRPGQDWPAMRAALKRYLEGPARALPVDRWTHVRVEGVPIEVDIFRSSPVPRLQPRVAFGLFTPGDTTLPERLREACSSKIEKLALYQSGSTRTFLLLESDDVSLMNHAKMAMAVRDAYPGGRPAGVDEFWYVSSILQPELHFLDVSEIWSLADGERFPVPAIWPERK